MRGEDIDKPCLHCGKLFPDFIVAKHEQRCEGERPMRYFERERMAWITEMLRVYGFINRTHLCRKFDISGVQAAHDFKVFQTLNPSAMVYDKSKKCYRTTAGGDHG